MKLSNRKRRFLGRWVSQSLVVGPLAFLLVAGSGCPQLFESDGQRTAHMREAVVGRDGDKTIGASANGTVVNTYAVLAAGATAGTRTITVDNIANLNVTAQFPAALAKGDLLLIIQMGGAIIDQTEGPTYGTVSAANLGNAGRYEFVAVESVAGNAITLACGLQKAYTGPSGKTQVIRVPQYKTLTISAGASITAPAWNGTVGGVVAVHADKTLQLAGDGKIDVSGLGFRGGATHYNNSGYPSTEARYHSTDAAAGGEKGEGIAGYEGEVTGGQYGRGAPANGGGGGDTHNAGGGGGANAGDPTTWTGQGVMVTTVTGGALAWPLDPQYAGRNFPGGGRGGYSFSGADLDATQASGAPELTGWDGDHRRNVGGLGGHPLVSSAGDRLFMGGGGGAGDGNNLVNGSTTNVVAGKGGNGGGIVFVIAGAISGTGRIIANGAPGGSTTNAANTASDAAGGGGGGGAVLVHAVSITGIAIAADGGVGGSQIASEQNEAEGPGGGGGGGYVAVSGTVSSVTTTVAESAGGTTRTNGPLSEFPSNGATAGHDGDKTGDASSFLYCGMDPNNVTLAITVNGPASPTGNPRGTFTFTASEGGVTFECAVDGTAAGNWTSCSSPYTTGLLSDGDHTFYVRGTDLSGNKATANYPWKIIAGELDAGTFHTTITDGPAKISGRPMGTFTFTNNHPPVTYQCAVDSTAAAAWTSCSSPYTTGLLPDGDHTFYVRATDVNGTVEAPPASYPWTIIAGLIDGGVLQTQITSAPPAVSSSPIGTFTFTNSHAPVTYQCALDSTAASAWHDCTSPFTTPLLPDGDHTFYVRATDVNGTVEAPPATYPWKIIAGQLDAGILDSGVDAQTGDDTADTAADTNTEKADVPIVVADTKPPVVDAGPDGKADVGVVLDTSALDGTARLDGGAADLADTAAIPEPGMDAGTSAPEPSPDAAVAKEDAAVKEDAAAPIGNKDAAVTTEDKPALLGGGFCAISPLRTSSSGAFALLGLAALALLRRRRDGRR